MKRDERLAAPQPARPARGGRSRYATIEGLS